MTIEATLVRIADALEKIAGTIDNLEIEIPSGQTVETEAEVEKKTPAKEEKKAPAEEKKTPPAEEKKVPADDGKVPDLDDVIAALQGYMKTNGRDDAVALLTKYDAKRASDIPEDKRAAFIKETS